jgi:hypothetical protein
MKANRNTKNGNNKASKDHDSWCLILVFTLKGTNVSVLEGLPHEIDYNCSSR